MRIPSISVFFIGGSWIWGAFISGCDPGMVVEGTVSDSKGIRIKGAKVAVDCKSGDQTIEGHTKSDKDGNFSLELGLGCLPDKCEVDVSTDRHFKAFTVGEHCETQVPQCDKSCNVVRIDAQFD